VSPVRRVAGVPPAPIAPTVGRASVLLGGQRVVIGPGGAIIGRSPDVDIVVAHSEVSRRHAAIASDEQGWTISDLGSTNGVRLNGHALSAPTRLSNGDVIELGDIELIFEVR
jgi:pSer/pThr/pTyr-binding forkhead associated (FHA) protein